MIVTSCPPHKKHRRYSGTLPNNQRDLCAADKTLDTMNIARAGMLARVCANNAMIPVTGPEYRTAYEHVPRSCWEKKWPHLLGTRALTALRHATHARTAGRDAEIYPSRQDGTDQNVIFCQRHPRVADLTAAMIAQHTPTVSQLGVHSP